MRFYLPFAIGVLCIVALMFIGLVDAIIPWWLFLVIGLSGIVSFFIILRGVVLPTKTVENGMNLIRSQDFNNRLAKVGEPNSDKIVALFNDMIDRLRNERLHNREQEGFLNMLVEASPMGIAILDYDGKVTLANPSFLKMTGINGFPEVIGNELSSLEGNFIKEMIALPEGKSEVFRKGDVGLYRCYHLTFMQTGFHRRFYLLESLTDEIIKAERAAYGKVIRTISHEVNNTMGGVNSVLELLKESEIEYDIKEVIESCETRCSKMCSFIAGYADVVKVPEPLLKKLNLNDEVRKLMPFFENMAGSHIGIYSSENEDVVCADIDSILIQQVLVNVVKNAVESIKGEGEIRIKVFKENGNPMIEVSNNGEPISEEVSQQLFSPFFTTKQNGCGIGLTLVGEILDKHKARYSLRTYSDGLTRFRIHFNNKSQLST